MKLVIRIVPFMGSKIGAKIIHGLYQFRESSHLLFSDALDPKVLSSIQANGRTSILTCLLLFGTN